MAALEQLHGGLTFADAAVADQENALAVDLHQHAVAGNPGRQRGFQVGDDGGNDGAGGFLGAQDGNIVLLRHLEALGVGRDVPGDEQRREFVGKQPVEDRSPLLGLQFVHIAHFHIAHDLQTHRLIMVKIARQLKAGSCHVLNGDADGVKIRGRVGDFQIKFLYQRFQRHTVCIRHGFHPESKLFSTIIPVRGGNINTFQKNKLF